MDIRTKKSRQSTVVQVAGKIDALGCSKLEESLNTLIDDGETQIIIDFEEVLYIGSAGLRVLLLTIKRLHGKGALALCCLKGSVREVIEMTGFDRLMNIYDGLETAQAGLSGG